VLATQLGQQFEQMLEDRGISPADIATLRLAMPSLSVVPDDGPSAEGWLAVCEGRVSNGTFVVMDPPGLTDVLTDLDWFSNNVGDEVERSASELRDQVFASWGPPFPAKPAAWTDDRLRYEVELATELPGTSSPRKFDVHLGADGQLDWYALDDAGAATGLPSPVPPQPQLTVGMLPAHVRFKGMPARRFWDLEHSGTDFGKVDADTRDLARLVVLDFMLLQSNDWYLIPFDQPVGSLSQLQHLVVHDVFGGETLIPNANQIDEGWALFATTIPGGPPATYSVLAPTLGSARQTGALLEDVRFKRDEMANMTWAIEHQTANGLGRPMLGHERSFSGFAGTPSPPGVPPENAPPVRYQVQTEVPPHWIPFLPVKDTGLGEVVLEKGLMVRPDGATYAPIQPRGRLLNPVGLTGRQRVREEEVPRGGARIRRMVCRARGPDGSTHLWVERRRSIAQGEANSGLKFDIALPNAEEP
jgi:hypothetical protein